MHMGFLERNLASAAMQAGARTALLPLVRLALAVGDVILGYGRGRPAQINVPRNKLQDANEGPSVNRGPPFGRRGR